MKIFRNLPNAGNRIPCVLTIGNFDGVHRGHQVLLKELCHIAKARGLASCVLTFEPHPREFFSSQNAPPRIYQLRDKLEALSRIGIDRVIIARFNARFAVQQPIEFIRDVIGRALNAHYLIIGEDFRFGAGGQGDFTLLKNVGWQYGFKTIAAETVKMDDVRISSSAIRTALRAGDIGQANQLLGLQYMISGHVVYGNQFGQTLGIPTLNLRIGGPRQRNKVALSGIFITQVHNIATYPIPAVASLGTRPTVDDTGREWLEVHLLDFAQSLYGRLVRVEFLHKLRDEEKYADLDTLRQAIAHDITSARDWFKQQKKASF